MARQTTPNDLRRAGIFEGRGGETIEAENGFVIVNRQERFGTAQLVALAGVTAQEVIQRFFATVKRFPIVLLADRLFVPCHHDDDRLGNARAAARSFAFGAGGFSSKSRTRKLSLAETCR